MKKRYIPLIVVCLTAFSACDKAITIEDLSGPGPTVSLVDLEIISEKDRLGVSETLQLFIRFTPENATHKEVTWETSDDAVATVDQTGFVTAIAQGAVTVKATSQKNEEISNSMILQITEEPTGDDTDFVTTWAGKEITVPVNPSLSYSYNVDWNNDGIFDQTGLTGDVSHIFDNDGKHTIRISGTFPAIQFVHPGEISDGFIVTPDAAERALKILSVDQWGTGIWLSMETSFMKCENLKVNATDIPNLSQVTSLAGMFAYASLANPDVSAWDIGNIKHLDMMFAHTTQANPVVTDWNTENVVSMGGVFWKAIFAKPDVSKWKTGMVTDMSLLFYGAVSANPDVSNWNISKVNSMLSMFGESAISRDNYGNALVRFALHDEIEQLTLPENIDLGTVPSTLCHPAAIEAKEFLIEVKNWNILDDGECMAPRLN